MSKAKTQPLIVIEGIDLSGKGEQAQRLVSWFQSQNLKAFYRHFPNYENLTGKAIARHLKKEWAATTMSAAERDPVDELVFQCLMTINRYEEAADLSKLLTQGVVVSDRYIPSGMVYGAINGVPLPFLEKIHAALPQPDVYILIDLPVSEARRRASGRAETPDRYEEQVGMQERARSEYLRLFRQHDWTVVDGLGTPDEVHNRITRCVPQVLSF